MTQQVRPRVVIIGGGFGGLAAAKALADQPVDVTLIDKRNHHLFQPLLYQVATAGLSPADISGSIRSIFARQANARVVLDLVVGIDRERRQVRCSYNKPIDYDYLIVATGARHSYFGRDDWEAFAPGIKTIEDATAVRRNILMALERAETETDPDRRKALLTFVIIGGGPTGVEMAGAIAELARQSVSMDFRHITPNCSKIVLVQRAKRLLPAFPESLSAKAKTAIEQLGVDVLVGTGVDHVDDDGVIANGVQIPAKTVIWAAGVQASRAGEWLTCACDGSGRVEVDGMLHACGDERIFVIGDTAACTDATGRMLPGVAPVAKQQGHYVAQSILATLNGRPVLPFRYRDYGNLATVGRSRAVADFGRFQLSGFVAWLTWSVAHIYFLTGFRSRTIVGLHWLWNYLTFDRSARLITGDVEAEGPHAAPLPAIEPMSRARKA